MKIKYKDLNDNWKYVKEIYKDSTGDIYFDSTAIPNRAKDFTNADCNRFKNKYGAETQVEFE